ncbi:T9SS type A sorting domain-containing protein [Spirosoma sp. KNUC1025]|uniref:T9SS type A sorting domain-containing protein n=1 Tax=Spirosoma sp. KNUC1025 TaxID=2894082 RepID=UPI003865494F|nr:T9SS type A sorting domain-containing protein [Spirosoma sp. KNUC1025]
MKRTVLFWVAMWLISITSLAQSGADPAVIANDLRPQPLANVGSVFSITFAIGNSGSGAITGASGPSDSLAERMGFHIDLKQCLPNPADISAVSGTILNNFDITYNASLNRFDGIQKKNVTLGSTTIRRFVVSLIVTQASSSTVVNTIGASCTIIPNSGSLRPNGTGGQPTDDDFSQIYTHTTTLALPVSLVSFSAQAEPDRTVLLKWTTSWEKANKGYVIERSKDLKTFEEIGEVTDVAGNSNSLSTYRYVDRNPHRGTSYYRLRQVDLDGTIHTFNAESVIIDGRYGVYPNPIVQQTFTLELDEPSTASLRLYNASGSELGFVKSELMESSVKLTPTSKLVSGIYILTVEERGTARKHRLVVQ